MSIAVYASDEIDEPMIDPVGIDMAPIFKCDSKIDDVDDTSVDTIDIFDIDLNSRFLTMQDLLVTDRLDIIDAIDWCIIKFSIIGSP